MKTYSQVLELLKLFGDPVWSSKGVKTLIGNTGLPGTVPYIRIHHVLGKSNVNLNSLTGQLLVHIFTLTKDGPKPLFEIADSVQEFLGRGSRISRGGLNIWIKDSSLSNAVTDSADKSLSTAILTINFELTNASIQY